jgi:outer membrane protein assembly factor BamE (lipoprotein component of BamABCDE complex)
MSQLSGIKKYSILPIAALALLFFASCNSIVQKRNLQNLTHLKKGMTKEEVLAIMGKPLTNEVYNTDNVWYYFTQSKWSEGMITRDECTPLFFEDGKLAGWGQQEYKKYRQRDWGEE